MNKKFTLLSLLLISLSFFNGVNAQTCYASITSGNWSDAATWETFSSLNAALAATQGTGSAASSVPSGTHNVLIRAGHTISMNGANRGCKGIVINAGGKLWANETTGRRLQIGAGGTGWTYPLVDTVKIDGVLGGPSDGVYIESGSACQTMNITGSGSIDILRMRLPGGAGASAAGQLTVNIGANINLWQATNYALSAVYNPAVTDDYTINILQGATVTTKTTDGYWHNSQNTATYGKVTYNILGTLDLSANTQTANNLSAKIIAPAGTASRITVNVNGGLLKTGAAFRCDTSTAGPVSTGILKFNVVNGGIVDATLATDLRMGKTSDGTSGYFDMFFGTDGTGLVKQNVAATDVKFPVGLPSSTTRSMCRIANSGTADVHSVTVKGTFDNTPADPTRVVNRQWTITEATAGGSVDTLRLGWVTADQSASFDPAANVYAMQWNGSSWDYTPVSISGTGTIDDPYYAKVSGVSTLSSIGITNFSALPLKLISFGGSFMNEGAIQLNWVTSDEINVKEFDVESSSNGKDFQTIRIQSAKNLININEYTATNILQTNQIMYYRLKMVNNDGSAVYSKIITLNKKSNENSINVFPNPASNVITVSHKAADNKSIIRIFNQSGKLVLAQSVVYGETSTPINITSLAAGSYTLQFNTNAINTSYKFIKK